MAPSPFLLLCFTAITTVVVVVNAIQSQPFIPADNYLINCGATSPVQLPDGRQFKTDPQAAPFLSSKDEILVSAPANSSVPSPLYATARIFTQDSTYAFTLTRPGWHWIRLHFHPFDNDEFDLTDAVFSVSTDDYVLLHSFNVDNSSLSLFKEYLLNATTDRLTLHFSPLRNSVAFINAIEVVSAPDLLISDSASSVSPVADFPGLSSRAFQTSYRLNVGGPLITPANDTLGRSWGSDLEFLQLKSAAKSVSVSPSAVNWAEDGSGVSPLIAPSFVYASAIEMADAKTVKPNFNVTWNLGVDPAFDYLIRLHFCDIVSKSLNDLYFNVYINGRMAVSGLDLSTLTSDLSVPYYKDLVFTAAAMGSDTITVQIGPMNQDTGSVNAILNGLEASAMEADGEKRTPRLFIKEMVMRNFKSYAGEQRVGPFHKSFSAVVGPNGSGKSNVIDAMLFVFGKRAKQMRLNKVSELIHNSTNHQNLESAGVSVHFQEIIDLDDGTYKAVEGSDFVITRVAFRDNSSKYYINDRSSNFTEVTKKLKGKGVDLDNNRFLILQGEVEQISLMKPKAQGPHDEGFLEYLEDIIGTNQYIEKIEESYKQLELLNEKRTGVVQMVKLAEKERDCLETVKNEAETYMLKELMLLKWQEKSTKLASDDAVLHVSELQENLTGLEENLKSEKEKIQETSKTLKELEAVHNKYLKRQEELDNDLRTCKDEFKEFERQDLKYREDLKHMKQKIKKLDNKLEKDSSVIEKTVKESEDSTNLIPELEVKIPKLQQLLQDEEKILEEIMESSKDETERHRSELVQVRAELEPWEKQLIEHNGKLLVACNERNLLKEKHESGRVALEDAQHQMNNIGNKIKEKSEDITKGQRYLEKTKAELADVRKEEQAESLIPLEQAARQKVMELSAVLESERSQGSVLKAILQAKDTQQIEGIYGRLGDLGAINAKYDVAISTACSGLDYIVVQTTAAAQACVELLRKKNLGVATFMILEKQTDLLRKMKEKVNTPEGVPRLFDLVKVDDERLKLAFFSALRNTIVAQDLDQATRIAYGGDTEFRRVVTLDGALFEKSGTMSGGGNKPRGGKMGTSIRASVSGEAVANAEKELAEMVDQLSSLRRRIADAQKHYQASERAARQLEMDLAKSQKEIENLKAQHREIEQKLDTLRNDSQPKAEELARLKELEKVIALEEKEMERLTKCSKKLKDKASELQNKIENAGGERLKSQKLKVTQIQSDIDKTSTEINRRKVQIVTGEDTIKKLTKGIEESKRERERVVGEKDKMINMFKEIEQKAFLVQENYKKTQELINKHKEVLDEAKSEYNKLKKNIDVLRAAEVDAEYKLQDMKKLLKEWEMKGKGFKKRLDDIQRDLTKHMEQIKKDAIDPEKIKATLADKTLHEACELKRAVEMVALFEAQLKELNPNLDSITEYRQKASLYNERVEELNSATQERDELKKQYDELRKRRQTPHPLVVFFIADSNCDINFIRIVIFNGSRTYLPVCIHRLDEFMAGFNIISLKLKEMYQMITLGGDAELELVDSLDPFSEGVVFSVRPPKKSWKNIANLSGGEKTLSSLALVFALHHYKPTPLYVMDEIDAALDFKNVSIVGHYVKDRTKNAQFVIIRNHA
ncbi:Structural maintenance of chromosomes protein 4 [Acorus calamus]|uniref:Structural maintenance of chromosomes protein 4 n=1 Tax=Acorus calamus TaxID=4465 RepID=A0AAV9DWP9_ACOCL|nr:Structural maintenance of chromosomes protein 4 [Acorus calamus]